MGYYYPYYPTSTYYPYYPTYTYTTTPKPSTSCNDTCRMVVGSVVTSIFLSVILSLVACCVCRACARKKQHPNNGVVHISNDDENNPNQPYTPMMNPYSPNPAPWQPPPPPPPQPVYGVPLAQPTDPNQVVVPLGYASPSYPPATGGYAYGAPPPPPAQYVGYTDGSDAAPAYAGAGNMYYSRSADAAEGRDAVRPMPDVNCGTGTSKKK